MAEYSQGGIVQGPGVLMRFVPEPSPDGNGDPRMQVIYADECFINKDMVCTRRDAFHAAVPGSVRSQHDRFWVCPLHDGEPA